MLVPRSWINLAPPKSWSNIKMWTDNKKDINIDSKHTTGKWPSQAFWFLSPCLCWRDAGIGSSPLWPAWVETENKWNLVCLHFSFLISFSTVRCCTAVILCCFVFGLPRNKSVLNCCSKIILFGETSFWLVWLCSIGSCPSADLGRKVDPRLHFWTSWSSLVESGWWRFYQWLFLFKMKWFKWNKTDKPLSTWTSEQRERERNPRFACTGCKWSVW